MDPTNGVDQSRSDPTGDAGWARPGSPSPFDPGVGSVTPRAGEVSYPPPRPAPVAPPAPTTVAPPVAPTGARRRRASGRRAGAALALVAVSFASGLGGAQVFELLHGDESTAAIGSDASARTVADRASTSAMDVEAVLARVERSVVSVHAEVVTQMGRFSTTATSAGTGIVVGANGRIVTNAHVVEGARSVTVTFAGESNARTARVVSSDAAGDLAVLQVDGVSGLTPVTWATEARVGQDVIAIGDALALEGAPSVTRGIVSALDRSVDTSANVTMTGLIQTDAAISSGNSGGPLVDADGHVVGVNSLVASSTQTTAANNIGFAIPAARVQAFLRQATTA